MNLTPDQLAEHASRILSDPAFVAAVEELDEGFVQEWRTARTTEEREAAFHKQDALGLVLRQLNVLVNRGGHDEA